MCPHNGRRVGRTLHLAGLSMPRPPYSNGTGLQTNRAALDALRAQLEKLATTEVLVGFPQDTSERTDDSVAAKVTNATIAYAMDHGMPERNVPARPFMYPGMESAIPQVTDKLRQMATAVSQQRYTAVDQGWHQVGLIAATAIKMKINEGIPPPLADSTLRDRLARHPSRQGERRELANRAEGGSPGMTDAKPLVDTGQLRNAVNYTIRMRTARSR